MRGIRVRSIAYLIVVSLAAGGWFAGPAAGRSQDCGKRYGKLVPCITRLVYSGSAKLTSYVPWCGLGVATGISQIGWVAIFTRKVELLYGRDFATLATVTGAYVVNQPTCGNQPAMTCTSRFVLLPGASPRYVTTSFVRRWHVGVHPWEGLNRSGPPQPCASSLHPLNDLDAVGYALLIGRRNPKRHTQVFPVAGGCNRIYGKYGSTFRFTGVVTVQGVW